MVHAPRREPAGAPDRGAHRLGANGGWLDGASTSSPARKYCAGSPPRERRAPRCGSSTGQTRRGRASAAPSSAPRRRRARCATRTSSRGWRPRRLRATRRAARPRRRARAGARGALPARGRGRLPRAAHRAGPGARGARASARRRSRHLRRRALADHLARPGRARGLDADGPAPRRARRRGEARARDPLDRRAKSGEGAVCTSGGVVCTPGIVTSVVETAEQLLDQRHLDAVALARLLAVAREPRSGSPPRSGSSSSGSGSGASSRSSSTSADRLAEEAVLEVGGTSHRLPSGPLHDAAEVARAGVPTVMLFVQSLRGLSPHKARGHRARPASSCRSQRSTGSPPRRWAGSPRAERPAPAARSRLIVGATRGISVRCRRASGAGRSR